MKEINTTNTKSQIYGQSAPVGTVHGSIPTWTALWKQLRINWPRLCAPKHQLRELRADFPMTTQTPQGEIGSTDFAVNPARRNGARKMKYAAIASILIGLASGGHAAPMFGLDYLGGAKYPDVILANHPEGWAAGFFATQFGDAQRVVTQLIETKRCPLVRIQLVWGGSTHQYGDQHIATIVKEAERWEKLKRKYPETIVELSPFCEHQLKNPDKYLAIVAKHAPSCVPVNTPDGNGHLSAKYKNEIHGSRAVPPRQGAFNFSYDGQSAVDSDVEGIKTRMSKAACFFFWEPRFNGNWEDDERKPIAERTAWPSEKLIKSLVALSRPKGPTSLPAKWLYKSHAENNGDGDPRAEKPVMICPVKAQAIELKSSTGKVVEVLKYYGTYVGGGYRYYGTEWGFETARKLRPDSLADVWVDGKKIGQVNPAFRDGIFR